MKRLLSLLALAAGAAQAQVTIEAPLGGWKHSGGEPAQHRQDINYPASRVNAGADRYTEDGRNLGAAIRGRIAQASGQKSRAPHLLVVNGIPMPISTGPDGSFARPYSFPPGSNNVEIKSADRKHVRRVNFYDANEGRQRVGLRVVLSWDTDMTDLDLHVVSPDGEHVFFGKPLGANGGALDVDVTGGYGPEIYAIPAPPKGNWQVYVNYFGGWGGYGDETSREITVAQVAIVTHEGTPDEKRQVFRIPLRRPGELTLVKSFIYP
ncbi:MAG TPA: DUF2135 domain-containing protein [Rhodocyclaceae bacterium]|nr:DUF2135 domain-containing protein [Rhodocyclaceae bacterium]